MSRGLWYEAWTWWLILQTEGSNKWLSYLLKGVWLLGSQASVFWLSWSLLNQVALRYIHLATWIDHVIWVQIQAAKELILQNSLLIIQSRESNTVLTWLHLIHSIRGHDSSHLTPIADLSERKIEIFTVLADPVSNSLCQRFLNLIDTAVSVDVFLILKISRREVVVWNYLLSVLKILVLFIVWAEVDKLLSRYKLSHLKCLRCLNLHLLISLWNKWINRSWSERNCISVQTITLLILWCLSSFQQMLWLSIKVLLCLNLLTPVALNSSIEVVILTLRAHPSTIGEVEVGIILIELVWELFSQSARLQVLGLRVWV